MKKLIALILAIAMTLIMTVGCGLVPELPPEGNTEQSGIGGGDSTEAPEDNITDVTPPVSGGENNTPVVDDGKDKPTDNPPADDGKDEPADNPPADDSKDEPTDNPPADDGKDEPADNPPAVEEPEEEPLPEYGTTVGKRFMDLTLQTMDGGTVNTADLRGKIIIFNVWATWCPPCKAELPDFNRIASEYKDKVVIIAADVDAGYNGASNYVQQNFPDSDIIFLIFHKLVSSEICKRFQ